MSLWFQDVVFKVCVEGEDRSLMRGRMLKSGVKPEGLAVPPNGK